MDDEFIIALELETIFQEAGATIVGPFHRALDGARAAAVEALDLAVLDVRLGTGTSRDIAAILQVRHVPFFFYSGQSAPSDLPLPLGRTPMIEKPAHPDTLVAAACGLIAAR